MHVLATIAARKQDSETELRWLMESLKVHPSIEGFRDIAILKAREGFHTSALKDLENLTPITNHAEPLAYCDFLNSYAVELSEAGRKQEARNISRVVLASPFAPFYPEWHDTARDLREPNRSFVTVPLIEREHVKIETTQIEHASKPEPEQKYSAKKVWRWGCK